MDQGGQSANLTSNSSGSQALGQAVGDARRTAGLTQQELCNQASISYSTLAKIERGAIKTPNVFTVATIAKLTQTTVEALVEHASKGSSKPTPRQYHTSKNGIRFVFFDVNGVLLCFYRRAFSKIASDTGVSEIKIENVFWRHNDAVCRGQLTVAEFNNLLSQQLGLADLDWLGYYLDAVMPVVEVQACLKWAAKYYKVGLLTNIMPGLLQLLIQQKKLPKLNYEVVMDSSTVGLIKPEPAFYKVAMQRAAVEPDQILFIDDAPTNLMSAEQLGWQVLHFNICSVEQSTAAIRQALELQ